MNIYSPSPSSVGNLSNGSSPLASNELGITLLFCSLSSSLLLLLLFSLSNFSDSSFQGPAFENKHPLGLH